MTYQRPAYEEVVIAHDGYTVTLRPSLRAAVTLESRFGFPALYRALDDFSITVISEIILAASRSRQDAAAFLLSLVGKPLFPFFLSVRQPLAELVSMLTPAPDTKAKATTGKPVAWPDFYSDLYEKATGWLRWPPETAWNATPTEIDRSYLAFIERSRWLGGSSEDDKQPTDKAPDPEQAARNLAAGLDPEFDRMGLRALKAKIASKA